MKLEIFSVILIVVLITIVAIILVEGLEVLSGLEQTTKALECSSIVQQYKVGSGSQIEQHNENISTAYEECHREYVEKYGTGED